MGLHARTLLRTLSGLKWRSHHPFLTLGLRTGRSTLHLSSLTMRSSGFLAKLLALKSRNNLLTDGFFLRTDHTAWSARGSSWAIGQCERAFLSLHSCRCSVTVQRSLHGPVPTHRGTAADVGLLRSAATGHSPIFLGATLPSSSRGFFPHGGRMATPRASPHCPSGPLLPT